MAHGIVIVEADMWGISSLILSRGHPMPVVQDHNSRRISTEHHHKPNWDLFLHEIRVIWVILSIYAYLLVCHQGVTRHNFISLVRLTLKNGSMTVLHQLVSRSVATVPSFADPWGIWKWKWYLISCSYSISRVIRPPTDLCRNLGCHVALGYGTSSMVGENRKSSLKGLENQCQVTHFLLNMKGVMSSDFIIVFV